MLRADFIISAKLWLLFPKIKIFSSAEHSDEHMKHLWLSFTICFLGVSSASTLARLSDPDFRAKAYVIRTLLLCDWSVKQTASKRQTQLERNVVRMWATVSLGERCVTSQKMAAKETRRDPSQITIRWSGAMFYFVLFVSYFLGLRVEN